MDLFEGLSPSASSGRKKRLSIATSVATAVTRFHHGDGVDKLAVSNNEFNGHDAKGLLRIISRCADRTVLQQHLESNKVARRVWLRKSWTAGMNTPQGVPYRSHEGPAAVLVVQGQTEEEDDDDENGSGTTAGRHNASGSSHTAGSSKLRKPRTGELKKHNGRVTSDPIPATVADENSTVVCSTPLSFITRHDDIVAFHNQRNRDRRIKKHIEQERIKQQAAGQSSGIEFIQFGTLQTASTEPGQSTMFKFVMPEFFPRPTQVFIVFSALKKANEKSFVPCLEANVVIFVSSRTQHPSDAICEWKLHLDPNTAETEMRIVPTDERYKLGTSYYVRAVTLGDFPCYLRVKASKSTFIDEERLACYREMNSKIYEDIKVALNQSAKRVIACKYRATSSFKDFFVDDIREVSTVDRGGLRAGSRSVSRRESLASKSTSFDDTLDQPLRTRLRDSAAIRANLRAKAPVEEPLEDTESKKKEQYFTKVMASTFRQLPGVGGARERPKSSIGFRPTSPIENARRPRSALASIRSPTNQQQSPSHQHRHHHHSHHVHHHFHQDKQDDEDKDSYGSDGRRFSETNAAGGEGSPAWSPFAPHV